jgi:hypothetical protein
MLRGLLPGGQGKVPDMFRPPTARPPRDRWTPDRDVVAGVAFTAVTAILCAGLFGAAALVPAPVGVLPMVALVCIGGPMLAAWDLSRRLARAAAAEAAWGDDDPRRDARAIAELRRALARLPETRHPLGL